MFPNIVGGRAAYTLLELMVGVTTASAIFAVILTSRVAIYRSCSAAEDYSHQSNDQLRAVDYLTRDLRSALSVTIPLSGQVLLLTMPDSYTSYDGAGIPTSMPVDPVIVDGVPVYGDATQPVTVTYSVSNGSLVREQFVPSSGQTTQLVVASEVGADFIGILNAPTFDLMTTGSGKFMGAAIARSAGLYSSGGLHYDEHPANFTYGGASEYQYASWIEDLH